MWWRKIFLVKKYRLHHILQTEPTKWDIKRFSADGNNYKLPSVLSLYFITSYGMGYPFYQFRSAGPSSVLSQLLQSPSTLPGRKAWEAKLSLALYSSAQKKLKRCCAINIVFLLKLKHSIIPDTWSRSVLIRTPSKSCLFITDLFILFPFE